MSFASAPFPIFLAVALFLYWVPPNSLIWQVAPLLRPYRAGSLLPKRAALVYIRPILMEIKRFTLRIYLFLIPLVIAFAASEYLLRRHIPNLYSTKYEHFLESRHRIKTLVLGSSHTHYGIDPNYFSMPAYNLANVSQSLIVDLKLLERER